MRKKKMWERESICCWYIDKSYKYQSRKTSTTTIHIKFLYVKKKKEIIEGVWAWYVCVT